MLSLIVAMDKNGVIGKDNDMPWGRSLPADLENFKKLTMNHIIIMGRKTFNSLPKILPGRIHLMMTKSDLVVKSINVISCKTIEKALYFCEDTDAFVIGGAEIYKLFMPYVERMYITRIEHEFEGDTYFPEIDLNEWELVSDIEGIKDEKNKYDHSFLIYERKTNE
jgi:dihydrofolate reductase